MTNPNVMTMQEVCEYFNVSQKTIRRRVEERRSATSSFSLPIFGNGQKAIWYRNEVEGWREERIAQPLSKEEHEQCLREYGYDPADVV